jgi:hypothetical protein
MTHRKTPGRGSRLRGSETLRVTGNYDPETVDQARAYAQSHKVSLAEALRQLVGFGLETHPQPAPGGKCPCFSSSRSVTSPGLSM